MKLKHSWDTHQKAEFLIRIGTLLEQGYTITEGVNFFSKYQKENQKPLLRELLDNLHRGVTISKALEVLSLPQHIIGFVYLAEHYGNLPSGLIDGGNLLKKSEELKEKLQKLLKYPLFLMWMLSLFMVVMYQYLFPQFLQLFSTMNVELPFITKMFLHFIKNSPLLIPFILIVLASFAFYYLISFRKKTIRRKAKFYSSLPLFGSYYQIVITYMFSTNLSYLIKNGISIYDSLMIFKKVEGLGYISEQAERLIERLEAGEQLQNVIINETLYLDGLGYIIEHGQTNSRLDEELSHYSDWLFIELDNKLKKLLMIVQPILFLFIGLIVLVMFAAILLPVFSLIKGL
ncbi:competence type IV pilus assembly protein ComGB [Anaerobacillus alkaliphilus]|nr:competence type IV pilus assembly protein ComGB [Anaerobacillus alkaliphilus]